MFSLLTGQNKKQAKQETQKDENYERVKNLFLNGKFPVVTTNNIEGSQIAKVLGLVCCRGFDSDEAFFGMASRAVSKGAHAIIGYNENVAFHPDGSRYFSCYGTAVMFEWDQDEKYGAAALRESQARFALPTDSVTISAPHAPRPSASSSMMNMAAANSAPSASHFANSQMGASSQFDRAAMQNDVDPFEDFVPKSQQRPSSMRNASMSQNSEMAEARASRSERAERPDRAARAAERAERMAARQQQRFDRNDDFAPAGTNNEFDMPMRPIGNPPTWHRQ